MKITISPSDTGAKSGQHSVTIDTNSNREGTLEAVEMALKALVAYSHTEVAVNKAAGQISAEQTNKP